MEANQQNQQIRWYMLSEIVCINQKYLNLKVADSLLQNNRINWDALLQKNQAFLLIIKNSVCFLIIFYSYYIKAKPAITMNNINLSDTQSSQFSKQETQPPLAPQLILLSGQVDPEQALVLIRKISENIKAAKGQEFQVQLNSIVSLISKGYAKQFFKFPGILNAMMKQFCSYFRNIDSDAQAQGKSIFLLSTIAELVREAGRCTFPFSQKFLKNLFLIDEELLEQSPYKDSILAILGVVYENISRQGRLLKKYEMTSQFKKILLTNYHLINQGFSARLFNKCLYTLAVQGQPITQAELHKYQVFETISKFLPPAQVQYLIEKIKSALSEGKNKKVTAVDAPKSEMIAQL